MMIFRSLNLPKNRSFFLFGPRQVGKSTLIRSILPPTGQSWTVDLLHHEAAMRYSKAPELFRREAAAKIAAGVRVIFVDEVQKVPSLLDAIHALIEETGAQFILTGSSARKLRRGGVNLLAGRASTRHLHPLTYNEMGPLFDLERVLRYGSLPAVVTTNDEDATDMLRAYGQTYLREEIQAEAIVRNMGGFGRFLDVAAAQFGELCNFNAVGRDAAVATRTVRQYYEILEDTLIGLRVPAWRKSERARLATHPRFYFFDTGVVNALNRRLAAPLDPVTRGRLFEQWVVCECHRTLSYQQDDARLFFWRTNHGAEVDLLIESQGQLRVAVEIKSSRQVSGADCTGLRSFASIHPRVPRVIVACVQEPYRLDEDIEVLPYEQFLKTGLLRFLEKSPGTDT